MTELNNIDYKNQGITWLDEENNIDEVKFCEAYLQEYDLKCINGSFFSIDGFVSDGEIEKNIYNIIKNYVARNVSKKVKQLLEVLRFESYSEELPIQNDRIHVKNGTIFLNGMFSSKKEFCLNRLPIKYNPQVEQPKEWLAFLEELLEKEDILTLQEYMGYCLIPSTKGQKMMLLIGKGGEGKSRIGLVLRSILGNNMNTSSIQKVEINKFARADLEYKLLMVDDDMKMEALPQTNYIKSIVTLEDKIDLERKSKQSVQGTLYVRFLCFGNGNLNSLYDRSYGFFRRQIVLTTKEKDKNRKDNPFLIEKLRAEKEGIFLWCLEGLKRLLKNDYEFTISEKASQNLYRAMEDGNNIISFMKADDFVKLEPATMTTSKKLYGCYCHWCDENVEKPISAKSFISYLKQSEKEYNIQYSTNILSETGKKARGFKGIYIKIRT